MTDLVSPISKLPPPADLNAEAAVLGGLLYDARHLDTLPAELTHESFFSGAHQRIFEAVASLRDRRVDVSVTTVEVELGLKKRLAQLQGGAGYLHKLVDETAVLPPNAFANLVRVVLDKAAARAAILVCQRAIARLHGDGDVRAMIADVESDMQKLTLSAQSGGLHQFGPALRRVRHELNERRKGRGNPGLTTGFRSLDRTLRYKPGTLHLVAARPGMGKAQPYDAMIQTPAGPRSMGSLAVGDLVIGSDGKPTEVLGVYEQGEREVYRVTLDDGASTECCDEHLWVTRTRTERRGGLPGQVRSLSDIRTTLSRAGSGGLNHSIAYADPVEFGQSYAMPLPVNSYVLGLMLGDGTMGCSVALLSNPETDIQEKFADLLDDLDEVVVDGMTVRVRRRRQRTYPSELVRGLRALGLAGKRSHEKFIPPGYLRSSVRDRVELLQGLFDSDGFVTSASRSVEYTTTSPMLRDGVVDLVRGLGGTVSIASKVGHYRKDGQRVVCREAYRMVAAFPTGKVVPVSSRKHLAKWKGGPHRIKERFISNVELAGTKLCRCIRVAAPNSLYVTAEGIVTHNTSYLVACARKAAEAGEEVGIFSLEMIEDDICARAICTEAGISVVATETRALSAEEYARVDMAVDQLEKLPIYIDDAASGRLTATTIVARIRRWAAELVRKDKKPRLVFVDYAGRVQLDPKSSSERHDIRLGEIPKAMKSIAKELGITVILLSQLNRGVESRQDKRPVASDLKDSGALEEEADAIVFLYRDEFYERERSKDPGVCEIIVDKNRYGPTGVVKLAFDGPTTRFSDLNMDPDRPTDDGQETVPIPRGPRPAPPPTPARTEAPEPPPGRFDD